VKFTVRGTGLLKGCDLTGIENASLTQTPYHITKGPIYSSSFYPVSRLQGILKSKKQKQQIPHSLKRQSKHQTQTQIWQILELSDWEFKTTMINMLRDITDKIDNL
jgi:hypothetical protein